MFLFVSHISLVASLLLPSSLTISLELNACDSRFHVPTQCVPLISCPLLRKQFEEGRHNPQIIKYFQKLICGFHVDSPKICCPTATLDVTFTDKNLKVTSNDSAPLSESVNDERLRNHKHFSLIPTLEHCGAVPITDRIIGGTDAPFGAYPWLARIGYKVAHLNEIQFGCAGSIISSRYLISAAHCFHGIDAQIIPKEVRINEYDIRTNPDCNFNTECSYVKDMAIEKIIVHNDYNPNTKLNDIALIRVSKEIPFQSYSIQPVCLPFSQEYKIDPMLFENATEIYVAGWGKTQWDSESRSPILQHVRLPIVSNKKCQAIYRFKTRLPISSTQLCAGTGGDAFSSRDTCSGDSGGASTIMYHSGVTTKIFQVGIVSYGATHCGRSDSPPGVYTRVDQYLKWILDSIEP